MIAALAAYLEQRPDGAPALELVRDALGLTTENAALAETLVATAVADDDRFFCDARGLWHLVAVEQRNEPLADASFVAVECTQLPAISRPEPVELAGVRFDAAGHRETIHRLVRPGEFPAADELHLLGLDAESLATAPPRDEVLGEFESFAGSHPRVSHRPSESLWTPPLDFAEEATPPWISLARLARRLYGQKLSLAQLADRAGLPHPGPSAADRARVAADAFLQMLPLLAARGVQSVEELIEFQSERDHTMDFAGLAFDRDRIDSLPAGPGVYRMLDRNGQILYVGKAANLRRRVSSYFANRDELPGKVQTLLENLFDMNHEECGSELAALLREAELIERFQPPINRQMAVKPGPPIRPVPDRFVVVLPCFARIELFAVKPGRPLVRREIDPEKVRASTLRAFLKKTFYDPAETSETEDAPSEIVRRWLARERDRAAVLDIDAAGSPADAARLLKGHIVDVAGEMGKTFRV